MRSGAGRRSTPRSSRGCVAAGAVVVAKTRSWDDGAPGRAVLHPLDATRTPGGSSSGEAVAVAAGASLLGIGSDSGGSIRLPAAWCGVLGFKPTAGRVPTTGHFPRVGALSDGRTQIGPMAPDLDDHRAGAAGDRRARRPRRRRRPGAARRRRARRRWPAGASRCSSARAAGWRRPRSSPRWRAAAAALAGAGLERVEWTCRGWTSALDITRALLGPITARRRRRGAAAVGLGPVPPPLPGGGAGHRPAPDPDRRRGRTGGGRSPARTSCSRSRPA